jgi:transcriptional regulator with XRE-family HTH domain
MARKIIPTPLPESPQIRTARDFGAFVRSLRTTQGLRIDDAAALCGVSVALLSALENGKEREVGLEKALQVAQELGLAVLATPKSDLPKALACLARNP